MSVRAVVLVLLLAVVGGAAGYAYADSSSDPRISRDPAAPLAAADPAIPYTPPEKVNPDSELPPLSPSLPMHDTDLGRRRQGGVVLPVPDGWFRNDLSTDEARWLPPDNPAGSYSVRVAVIDMRRTPAQAVAERAAALPGDSRLSDLEILSQEGDTLRASFILSGYRKLQVTRWISLDGAGIDVEVSAEGRLIDEAGLDGLVSTIAAQVRRQPKPQRKQPEE